MTKVTTSSRKELTFPSYWQLFSRTPDQDFRCFYPCEITVPARGKDKKGTAARQSHAGSTLISDIIVMLK